MGSGYKGIIYSIRVWSMTQMDKGRHDMIGTYHTIGIVYVILRHISNDMGHISYDRDTYPITTGKHTCRCQQYKG